MKDPTVRGVVHLIEETKTFGQKGFRKRLLVLEQSKTSFTNFIPVEFVKDGCDAVDDLAVGDEIEVVSRRAQGGSNETIDPNDALAEAGDDDVPF